MARGICVHDAPVRTDQKHRRREAIEGIRQSGGFDLASLDDLADDNRATDVWNDQLHSPPCLVIDNPVPFMANHWRPTTRRYAGVSGDAVSENVAVGRKGAWLPLRGRNGDDYVAHVLSLTTGSRRQTGLAYSAAAAVFVRKAEFKLPHPVETFAKRYRLTAAEMRVMVAIVEIGGVPEVGRMLGVSEATVKTYLQRIFDKTGVARQADLVKLVAGHISPLGG